VLRTSKRTIRPPARYDPVQFQTFPRKGKSTTSKPNLKVIRPEMESTSEMEHIGTLRRVSESSDSEILSDSDESTPMTPTAPTQLHYFWLKDVPEKEVTFNYTKQFSFGPASVVITNRAVTSAITPSFLTALTLNNMIQRAVSIPPAIYSTCKDQNVMEETISVVNRALILKNSRIGTRKINVQFKVIPNLPVDIVFGRDAFKTYDFQLDPVSKNPDAPLRSDRKYQDLIFQCIPLSSLPLATLQKVRNIELIFPNLLPNG